MNEIYEELVEIKENSKHIDYSMIVIDDIANQLKDNAIIEQLNKMVIKARHIACGFIFTAQSYFYMPKFFIFPIKNRLSTTRNLPPALS